jgi:hypothetical protein
LGRGLLILPHLIARVVLLLLGQIANAGSGGRPERSAAEAARQEGTADPADRGAGARGAAAAAGLDDVVSAGGLYSR